MSVFYNINDKTYEEQREIFTEAKNFCYQWEHDVLDCTKSFSRHNVTRVLENDVHSTVSNMWFEEIMKHFVKGSGCHVVFIDRQGYGLFKKRECWEIGFCTIQSGPDHFLFIHVDPTIAHRLIEKYNLRMVQPLEKQKAIGMNRH